MNRRSFLTLMGGLGIGSALGGAKSASAAGGTFHGYPDSKGVLHDTTLCIGCRSCVNACPFGAVDVVAAPQAFDFGGLSVGAASQASVIKCDRCVDRDNGPACVEACASHALRIMQREDDGSVHEMDGGVK